MKTTRKLLQILSITLLCLAMTVGLLAFPVAAEATPVAQVAVDDGKILNKDYPFLVDTGAGYATAEELGSHSMVAQFEAATGTLILKDYDGGAISTSAMGDLTIQLSGTNTISHDETGINMHYGGNLTITALYAATLNITNNTDDNKNYAGIGHKFDGALSLDATPSGDMITVTGNATVVINTALTYDGSCRAIGIVGHSGIAVSENASLHITATNENNNLAGCLFALGGDIEIDTTGDVSLLAQGESGNQSGENLLKASGTATLGLVGKLTMNWTYAEFYEESALTLDEDGGFTSEDYVIGTLTEDDTSKTYAYLFPISVEDGVAKVGDDAVTTATKGTTVTVEAAPPKQDTSFRNGAITSAT